MQSSPEISTSGPLIHVVHAAGQVRTSREVLDIHTQHSVPSAVHYTSELMDLHVHDEESNPIFLPLQVRSFIEAMDDGEADEMEGDDYLTQKCGV